MSTPAFEIPLINIKIETLQKERRRIENMNRKLSNVEKSTYINLVFKIDELQLQKINALRNR